MTNLPPKTPSSVQGHEPRPLLYLFCIILSTTLLLSLFACSKEGTKNDPFESEESSKNIESEAESSGDPAETTAASEHSASDDNLLLYYTSLIDELQKEILALKTENFILSNAQSESSIDVSVPPSIPFTYEEENGEITILSYTDSDKNPIVPAEIDGHPVTKIGESAFSGTNILSITLPDSVKEIDWFAFSYCASLQAVIAGESVITVGYGAFDGCPTALTLICPDNSYLSKYGKSFGIAVSEG